VEHQEYAMSLFSNAKDRLIESIALPILNRSFLAPYGRATEIRVNTEDKAAELLVELNGDDVPLRIRIGGYEFIEEDGETYVVIHAVDTSRAWMTTLAERYLLSRPVKLPREFAGVLSRLA
jgi:hypothetical protein